MRKALHSLNALSFLLASTICHIANCQNPGTVMATYDPVFGAPVCSNVAETCDTGLLVAGVGNLLKGGPEPNAPNTIDGCMDDSASVYPYDESINALSVSRRGGGPMVVGSVIKMRVEVQTAVDTSSRAFPNESEKAYFYYASNATAANWELVAVKTRDPGIGVDIMIKYFPLEVGDNFQAIRVNYGYAEYIEGPW